LGLNSDQCKRVINKSKEKCFEIVIPFDKIGHKDDLRVDMGNGKHHTLRVTVETDGISRILMIRDLDTIVNTFTVE
jgi:hypothetical protein